MKTYRIKPLEWRHCLNDVLEQFSASVIGGVYEVERRIGRNDWLWQFDDGGDDAPEYCICRTAAEGKALAEADWRETITRFLEEVTHE